MRLIFHQDVIIFWQIFMRYENYPAAIFIRLYNKTVSNFNIVLLHTMLPPLYSIVLSSHY